MKHLIKLIAIVLLCLTSCKNNYNTNKSNITAVNTIQKSQLNDSIKVVLDSMFYQIAKGYKCRVTAIIKGENESAYYSGFDGRANKIITDFNGLNEIGSNTKMFTATSILQLVEQGKFSLNDKLTSVLPNTDLYKDLLVIDGKDYIDSVKIINLLNHTSGFPDYFDGSEEELIAKYNNPAIKYTPEDLILMAKMNNKFKFIPETSFKYNNLNYIILGMIIKKVSGKTYQNYIQEHILNPLQLKHTYFGTLNPPKNRAIGHFKGNVTSIPMTLASSAGDIITTLDEMEIFIRNWNKGKLFKNPATIESVKNNDFQSMMGVGIKYGKGVVNLYDNSLGHAGQTFGFQTYMATLKNGYCFAFAIDDASVSAWYPAIAVSSVLNNVN